MTTPTLPTTPTTQPPDLADRSDDVWLWVRTDDDGTERFWLSSLVDDNDDDEVTPEEIEAARAEAQREGYITDSRQTVEDIHGPVRELPRPGGQMPTPAPAPEPVSTLTPDLIDRVGDHWTYVGVWDGDRHYVCDYPHDPAGPTDEQRSALRDHYNPRNYSHPPAHSRATLANRWGPLTERPRTVHDPRVDPPAPDVLEDAMQAAAQPAPAVPPPDLVDRAGDVWVHLGELDGHARYVCAGREARLRPAEIEGARRRPPQAGITRARIEADWEPLTERPRTAPEPPAQAPEAPAATLEPDLETNRRVWVYTGTADGVRRYRAIAKNTDGTPIEDVEDVRRRFTGGEQRFPDGSDTEGYVRSQGRVWDRPRDLGHAVDAFVAAQPAPEPAPTPEVTPSGWALDADGLPVIPTDGPDELRAAAATARAEALTAKLAEFKIKTRREVLDSQSRNGWCQPGTERVLQDLDLDKINAIRRADVTITVEISGTNSDQNAETFAKNKIERAVREALGDRLRGSLRVNVGGVRVTRHED